MQQVLKGVVVQLPTEKQPGLIKCGRGKDYLFTRTICAKSYDPQLRDIVAVTEENGDLLSVRLYHREGFIPQREATVDLRIKCPHCGKKMMPKAQFEDGELVATECPFCHTVLERMSPKSHSKKSLYLQWGLLAVGILFLVLAAFLNH